MYDTLGGHTAARMVGDTFDVGRKTRFGSIEVEATVLPSGVARSMARAGAVRHSVVMA